MGKSTLFKALTKKQVDIANYPFCTIEPNVGVVLVPDARIEKLAAMSHSQKIIPAAVEFVDIAGLVKGAALGEGLGNKFLSHIKEVDAIAEVVRVFEDKDILSVHQNHDPRRDIEEIEYELILKDLETATKRLESIEKEARAGRKGAAEEKNVLEQITKNFEKGLLLRQFANSILQKEILDNICRELQFLTSKPIIYVFNASENQIQNRWQPDAELKNKIGNSPWAVISAKIEAELAELPDEERGEYLKTYGHEKSGLDKLIQIGYQTLNLITFLTTGEDETRGWTIPAGSSAPRAGRAIHSDFEQKFIRAEVIPWQKLVEAGSWPKARELGLLRTEGKEYVVQDGDVIEFKI